MTETLTHNDLDVDDLDALYPAGEPLPESRPHRRVRDNAASVLEQRFDSRGDILVASNLNLYYREGDPAAVIEPDVLVVAGVAAAQLQDIQSYRTFQHGGSLLFVLEVASKDTASADRGRKRATYASIGVAEYWRVDPTGGELHPEILQGERLHDGHWTPIAVTVDGAGTERGHSTALDLDIAWRDDELLFHLPGSDQPLNNLARAETARRRAEAEAAAQAAEAAAQAAEAAAQAAEVARLKELLRRHGSPEAGRAPDPPG
ncbi:MAG: Uma2 family endonuclease [bacterium]|nr:Uma2 family endonuclease [bacterium]